MLLDISIHLGLLAFMISVGEGPLTKLRHLI
ncbi:hypothetical protein MTsPCn5_39420 [Croceitalea sp. MTPC5]|nr:hypothetical protein MTsPCn5_39420 [Croceitalea sp. MTPC5]